MALLTTGEFYETDFLPSTDAAWGALGSMPDIPSTVMDAIVNGTSLTIYVIDSATGQFAFQGGNAIGFDTSVLDNTSAAYSKITYTPTSGPAAVFAEDPGGVVWVYFAATDLLWQYAGADTTAFKAFLP
jgi:hypothetical protein